MKDGDKYPFGESWHRIINCRGDNSQLYGTNVPGGVLLILGDNPRMQFIPNAKIVYKKRALNELDNCELVEDKSSGSFFDPLSSKGDELP